MDYEWSLIILKKKNKKKKNPKHYNPSCGCVKSLCPRVILLVSGGQTLYFDHNEAPVDLLKWTESTTESKSEINYFAWNAIFTFSFSEKDLDLIFVVSKDMNFNIALIGQVPSVF